MSCTRARVFARARHTHMLLRALVASLAHKCARGRAHAAGAESAHSPLPTPATFSFSEALSHADSRPRSPRSADATARCAQLSAVRSARRESGGSS
eukprot:3024502-Pleurochrysis_carterae.AAC.1